VKATAKSILFGQICLFTGLLICILLKPAGLATNDGISYYGVYLKTAIPYTLGLLGAAWFCWLTGQRLREPQFRQIKRGLLVYAPLIVGIVLTPYATSTWIDYLHTGFSSALFSLQLALSLWLVWRLKYVWWSVILALIEVVTGILSAAYLNPANGFLVQSQIGFQLAFGALLIVSLQKLPAPASKS
jgi:hypothetical protein